MINNYLSPEPLVKTTGHIKSSTQGDHSNNADNDGNCTKNDQKRDNIVMGWIGYPRSQRFGHEGVISEGGIKTAKYAHDRRHLLDQPSEEATNQTYCQNSDYKYIKWIHEEPLPLHLVRKQEYSKEHLLRYGITYRRQLADARVDSQDVSLP